MSALVKIPMPSDVKQVGALMPDLSKRLGPINLILRKGVKFLFTPLWKNWYEKSSRSSRLRRFWFSLIETLSPTAHARSTCTAMLALTGLAPPSNRRSRTVP